ncbi:MAG TPA: hypothetical protein PKW95_21615 [bacterium]|nr:hypothetical protein [bacterium]
MPKSDAYEKAIIEPSIVWLTNRSVTERVLLFPLKDHLEAFLARAGYDRKRARRFSTTYYYPPPEKDRPGVLGDFLGAPETAGLVEELIVLGARELVFFGIAGSIDRNFRLADTATAQLAFADEGTSKHYFPDETLFYPDPALMKRLEAHLHAGEQAPRPAAIWTTDALYRETPSKVNAQAAAGRSLVEMEISALYAVAAFREIAAAAFVTVSDELFTGTWKPGTRRPKYRRAVARVMAALETWR